MITSLISGILGLLYLQLTFDVIKARLKHQISLGYGENNEIAPIVSAHSNFISYVPLFLILCFLFEQSALVHWGVILTTGLSFIIGRILHYIGFKNKKINFKLRRLGMVMTLLPLVIVSIGNIGIFFYKTFNL